MKKYILLLILILAIAIPVTAGPVPPNWKSWDNFPDTPRMDVSMLKDLIFEGEKVVLIYSGYRRSKIVCGSLFIPYTFVPPSGSGSKVDLGNISKDTLIAVY